MKKSHKRPMVSDSGEPHSSALYKVKQPVLKLKQKIILISSSIILLFIIFFLLWVLKQRHQAEIKAREANFNFARVLKEKAKTYAESQEWQLVKLFTVNSMLYQAKAGKFMPMNDIEIPLEFRDSAVNYLTFVYRPSYSTTEINQLVKEIEQQTGLVLDGTTPVPVDIYYSIDLDYYKNSGKYNNTIEAYNAAAEYYNSGSNHLNWQKYSEAITAFEESLKIRPHFKEALNKLGWAYRLNDEKGKANKIYKRAKKVDLAYYIKWNSQQWADLGDQQKNNRDYYNAVKSYKEALKISPGYYRAWNRLGEAYEADNRFDSAINLYNKAIDTFPASTPEWKSKILYNLALKYLRENQFNEAINEFKQAIQLYPQLDRAWIKLADAFNHGKKVTYRGKPWDFYFNHTDLKTVLTFIARVAELNIVIHPEVQGTISCELDQVAWDKALDLFLKFNGFNKYSVGNILVIGKTQIIKKFLKARETSDNSSINIKKYPGKPLDLSYFDADIHFVFQTIAAKVNLKVIIDPGINHSITCELIQVPWDMAFDVLMQMNGLSGFRFSNLIRVGKKAEMKRKVESEQGMIEILESLLNLDPLQVNFKDEKGKTMLFFAAEKGYPQLARFLISRGAKVNARDKWNFSPLHEAANKEVAEVLINSGALINVQANSGLNPLQTAVYGLRTDVARFLADKGAASNIFLDAAIGRFERVQKQVQRNPQIVNYVGMGGWTPLHHAVAAGQYKLVDFLISKNADINAETTKKETPLHLAISRSRTNVVKLLILNGARINARNKYGHTPLQIAKTNGDQEIIKLLEKYGGSE